MKTKAVLIVGVAAAGAWWLMTRQSQAGQKALIPVAGWKAQIFGTNGQPYTLYQDSAGNVRDQDGGLWT